MTENKKTGEKISVKIKFSRHAKRRAKLYNISETTISGFLATVKVTKGHHEIIRNVSGLQYPLKIVISVEGDTITVVTNYPLKKGKK